MADSCLKGGKYTKLVKAPWLPAQKLTTVGDRVQLQWVWIEKLACLAFTGMHRVHYVQVIRDAPLNNNVTGACSTAGCQTCFAALHCQRVPAAAAVCQQWRQAQAHCTTWSARMLVLAQHEHWCARLAAALLSSVVDRISQFQPACQQLDVTTHCESDLHNTGAITHHIRVRMQTAGRCSVGNDIGSLHVTATTHCELAVWPKRCKKQALPKTTQPS